MNVARATHTATLLNNSTVLVTGGLTFSSTPTDTAEIYDPGTHTWRLLPSRMTVPRADARAIKLKDGQVLVVGGAASPSAEIFDPLTEQFVATGTPTALFGNAYHSSLILLDDGRVLGVTGALTSFIYPFPGSSEIYDPSTNTWTATADIPVGVSTAASVKLQNGKVLATGGHDGFTRTAYDTVEMYDSLSNSSQPMASLLQSRLDHTATLLPDGKVLIAGGTDPSYSTNLVELYDASVQTNGSSVFASSLRDRRRHHTATQLPNGDVLVIGGFQSPHGGFIDAYLASAELYSVNTGTWSSAGLMATPRSHHTATLLPSGQVLVTGGGTQGVSCCDPPTNSVEIWTGAAPPTGTISVTTNIAAAMFTITGPARYEGSGTSFIQTDVPMGIYTITYSQAGQYITPAPETQTLAPGGTISFTKAYSPITITACVIGMPDCSHSLSFITETNFVGPTAAQRIALSSNSPNVDFTTNISVPQSTQSWFSITPTFGATPATINVNILPNLAPGKYTGQIMISAQQALNSQTITLSGVVSAGAKKMPPHLIVALFIGANFSGATGDPTHGDGLKQLSNEILENPGLPGAIVKIFSHQQFNDAIGFIASNLTEQDALILIGHSAGGNTARLLAEYLSGSHFAISHISVRVRELVVIDPIDLSLDSLNQSAVVKPRPSSADAVIDFYQRVGNVNGLPIVPCSLFDGLSICGYRIQPADFEFRYDVSHIQIDNDPQVHRDIMNILGKIFSD
jgi:Galactose oxidase, central domain/Kelch motif